MLRRLNPLTPRGNLAAAALLLFVIAVAGTARCAWDTPTEDCPYDPGCNERVTR